MQPARPPANKSLPLGSPTFIEYQVRADGLDDEPVIVGVEPDTGRSFRIAGLHGEAPGIATSELINVSAVERSKDALWVTGAFVGSLRAGTLQVDATSELETRCIDIDPGFGGGFADQPPHCRYGSRRVRNLIYSLFLWKIASAPASP
jgi:hypothetical protein